MSLGPERAPELVAAVDLGSNSFHMVIARQTGHDLQLLDRIREPVRLSAGLQADGHLDDEAQERALQCLERFGQRLRDFPPDRVRAVGTNALRQARQSPEFRGAARRALGHEIEIISGMEEARLIYLGVAHSIPARDEHRLVVDIGGGSTEIIHGHGFEPGYAASRHLGSVSFTRQFFPDGAIDRDRFRDARTAAQQQLRDVRDRLEGEPVDRVLGSSGTALAVSALLRHLGITDGRITYAGMKKLRRHFVDDPSGGWAGADEVSEDRLGVLPGGLAILMAIHRSLGIQEMEPSPGALREGLLYDAAGRVSREEVRSRTVGRMAERFAADPAQAVRVERSAHALLDQATLPWGLDREESRRILGWASRLHEAGLSVAHSGFHRHGAYLVANSDMPGFSVDDQALLAAVIRTHRRKIRFEYFDAVTGSRAEFAVRLAVLFRLAVLLNRGRTDPLEPALRVEEDRIGLHFAPGWTFDHPLTVADLSEEIEQLRAVDLHLEFGPET